jgi:enamine deaminase RidA (YjgF/YER057c/UK114 family)
MSTHRRIHQPPGLAATGGRWSHVASVELPGLRLVYVAGQTARTADGTPLPPDDLEAQGRQVYRNLEVALASAGAAFVDVVALRTYLVRGVDVAAWRRIRDDLHGDRFAPGADPPNTLIVVEALAHPDYRVEVDAQAVVVLPPHGGPPPAGA